MTEFDISILVGACGCIVSAVLKNKDNDHESRPAIGVYITIAIAIIAIIAAAWLVLTIICAKIK